MIEMSQVVFWVIAGTLVATSLELASIGSTLKIIAQKIKS